MAKSRLRVLGALLKGMLAALAVTIAGMAVIAALAVLARASDGAIRALNQALKCLAILAGTLAAVGRGGERGFVTGMALAILYMALGYGMAVALGGSAFSTAGMLGEILLGAALGAAFGAVLANLPARNRKARARGASAGQSL